MSGFIFEDERMDVVRNFCFGFGVCGGMYIVNIMVFVIEVLGMLLLYSFFIFVEDLLKIEECKLVGKYILEFLKCDLKLCDIII